MNNIIFYREWFPLEKSEFRILAMLADLGEFRGNLSQMCDYFSLSRQSRHTNALKASIQKLKKQNLIACKQKGRTYSLQIVPKAEKIIIPQEWMARIRTHTYTSKSVAWEQVLKVLLWIVDNKEPVVTNQMIADSLKTSISTIGCAKNVLQHEYNAITRSRVSEKIADDFFRTVGHKLEATAWWSSD